MSNPLGGLIGTTSSAPKDKWTDLSAHEKASILGQASDIYLQWLGRKPTLAEAQKWYDSGMSGYGLERQLIMSKEWLHTGVYKQYQRKYAFAIEQFFGQGYKLNAKLIQTFTAHGYDTTDIQAWIYRHPNIYKQSNDYKDRVASFFDAYQQLMGVDPRGTHFNPVPVQQRVDTNKKKAGVQGHNFRTVMTHPGDPLLHHAREAALHFNTVGEYTEWLKRTQQYQHHVQTQTASQQSDSGLQLDNRGRPVQSGLGRNRSSVDIPT